MNNIYVETMPSACVECPCCNSDVDYGACCNLCAYGFEEDYCTNQKHPNCPLKPLSDRLAEERKKVVQEVKQKLCMKDIRKQIFNEVLLIIDKKFNCCGYVEEKFEDIKKYVLDQIERGTYD